MNNDNDNDIDNEVEADAVTPPMICSICQTPILPEGPNKWTGGHNAEPINDGRCCGYCNNDIVIPARILRMRNIISATRKSGGDT
jgi:hypothetical protein